MAEVGFYRVSMHSIRKKKEVQVFSWFPWLKRAAIGLNGGASRKVRRFAW